jgi:hypothetical protein
MNKFSSENDLFPNENNVLTTNNIIKEVAMQQYYRSISNSNGIQITINSSKKEILPINSFNIQKSEHGTIIFKNGNTAIFNKLSTYIHTIVIDLYATSPNYGIVALDVINNNNVSILNNAIISKNINHTTEQLYLSFIHKHNINDEVQLRFGGGKIPGGGNLQLNIISITWIIKEN